MAIDWDFIAQKGIEGESEHLTGYVPELGSGFTVGSVDIGQHSREDIRTILQGYANVQAGGGRGSNIVGSIRKDLLTRLEPYTKEGRIGSVWEKYGSKEGYDMLAKTEEFKGEKGREDIEYIIKAKRYSFEDKLSNKKGWDNLDEKTQTILGSVGWQYGTGKNKTTKRNIFEEFWKIRNDKTAIHEKLINMGKSEYTIRRGKEAGYIQPPPTAVQETLNVDKEKETFLSD